MSRKGGFWRSNVGPNLITKTDNPHNKKNWKRHWMKHGYPEYDPGIHYSSKNVDPVAWCEDDELMTRLFGKKRDSHEKQKKYCDEVDAVVREMKENANGGTRRQKRSRKTRRHK